MTRMEEVKLAHTLRSLQEQIDVLKQEINKLKKIGIAHV